MRLVEETVLQKDMQQARPLNEATSPYNLWLYFGRGGSSVETTTSVELRHSGIGIAAICIFKRHPEVLYADAPMPAQPHQPGFPVITRLPTPAGMPQY